MKSYCKRWIQPLLLRKIKDHPIVVVTGARQVGKTTLLKEEFPDWNYLTLDDYHTRALLERDPEFILTEKQPLILDEVQRFPELFITLKKIVDENPGHRFILSGSANLLLMEQVVESLAGRAVFLELGPLTEGEILGKKPPLFFEHALKGKLAIDELPSCEKLDFSVWHGGMPQIYQKKNKATIIEWFEGYVKTYLEKDLRQLSQIDNLSDFRQLMIGSALRCGKLLNISEIGRDVGIKQPTAHRYMNLLEVSGLVHRLPAYAINRGQRLTKSSKLMWIDTGLACYLSGFYSLEEVRKSREWGSLLECFVFHQLKQLAALMTPCPRFYYWRTDIGREVDFVVEYGQHLIAIEVKASSNIGKNDIQNLDYFLKTYPQTKIGILLYGGQHILQLGKHLYAAPISILF